MLITLKAYCLKKKNDILEFLNAKYFSYAKGFKENFVFVRCIRFVNIFEYSCPGGLS